ncbi:hypothetical protein ACFL9U_16150 [Thermodesulfobacteriota bacterium]
MAKKIFISIVTVLMLANIVMAKPSKPIFKMLNTPITAFDFFLFQLEESCKCDKWFGNPNTKTDPCMTLLDYNINENIVTLNFYVHEPDRSTTYMKGFINSNEGQKEEILRSAIERLAVVIGVSARESMGKRYGLIQVTPVRRGWFSQDFDEAGIKDEVAKRTVLTIQTKYKGKLYHIERRINGQIFYEVSLAKETSGIRGAEQ